jgi:hypothetical protein
MSVLLPKRLFYLVLLVFLVWQLGSACIKAIEFLRPSIAWAEGVCKLDSFSQPSLAAAILRQEAQRLLTAYVQGQQQLELTGKELEACGRANAVQGPFSRVASERSGADQLTIQPIEQFERTVCELSTELNRMLILAYFQNGSWNEFIDRYLISLHTEPESAVVVHWAWCALESSQDCDRTSEVLDEFEHLTRFHPQWKTARGLKSVLDEWRATDKPAAARVDPPVYQNLAADPVAGNLEPGQP